MEMIYRSLERVVCLVSPVEGEKEREKKKEKKINSRDASTKEMGRKNYKENFNAPTVKNCYYEFCSCKNKFNLFLA